MNRIRDAILFLLEDEIPNGLVRRLTRVSRVFPPVHRYHARSRAFPPQAVFGPTFTSGRYPHLVP